MLPTASDALGNVFVIDGVAVKRRDALTFEWQDIHELPQAEYVGVAVSGTILICIARDRDGALHDETLLGVVGAQTLLAPPPPPPDGGARDLAAGAQAKADAAAALAADLADRVAALSHVVDALPTRTDMETQAQARASDAVRAIVEEARQHHNELRMLIAELVPGSDAQKADRAVAKKASGA